MRSLYSMCEVSRKDIGRNGDVRERSGWKEDVVTRAERVSEISSGFRLSGCHLAPAKAYPPIIFLVQTEKFGPSAFQVRLMPVGGCQRGQLTRPSVTDGPTLSLRSNPVPPGLKAEPLLSYRDDNKIVKAGFMVVKILLLRFVGGEGPGGRPP
ncbi:hypothetical protein EVAR_32938_1 [Eumeta japonica]|uniref:Uncharacterized protein n=1 Tax=Eumeta variegata TaxID=151549 RepID=A0A4C1X6V7_EUMVA|nr:hypothetical protein EVAR_32938_1 [Eumeta japonica]